jgi:hypothetical protein
MSASAPISFEVRTDAESFGDVGIKVRKRLRRRFAALR